MLALMQCLYKFAALKFFHQAGVAQLVEHNLAKVRVASSSLVSRSSLKKKPDALSGFFLYECFARMVESVDTQDLKSCGHCGRVGSSPTPGTFASNLTN